MARERRSRMAEEREHEREQGRQFSEMVRQSYEWLEGTAGEEKPNDRGAK